VDVPTLIVLGAAGGLLRGAVDLYTRFLSWQAVRLSCLQAARQAPRFREHFDPSTDLVAPVVHTVMGSGAAVLFGTTGQISGAYAALVVGMSAPMLLTQLTRVQTVSEALTGDQQSADPAEAAAAGSGTATADPVRGAATPGATTALDPSTPPPPPEPRLAPSLGLVQAAASDERPLPSAQPMSSPRPSAAMARTQEASPGEPAADQTQLSDSSRSEGTSLPMNPSGRTGSGLDGHGTPRWRHGAGSGEEGL